MAVVGINGAGEVGLVHLVSREAELGVIFGRDSGHVVGGGRGGTVSCRLKRVRKKEKLPWTQMTIKRASCRY